MSSSAGIFCDLLVVFLSKNSVCLSMFFVNLNSFLFLNPMNAFSSFSPKRIFLFIAKTFSSTKQPIFLLPLFVFFDSIFK